MFSIRRCGWHWVLAVGLLLQVGIVAAQEGQAPEEEMPPPLALVKSGHPGVEVANTKRARVVELDPKLWESDFSKGDQLTIDFFDDARCSATIMSVQKSEGVTAITAAVGLRPSAFGDFIDIILKGDQANIKWRTFKSDVLYMIGYHTVEHAHYAVELLPAIQVPEPPEEKKIADGNAPAQDVPLPEPPPKRRKGGPAVTYDKNNPIVVEKLPEDSALRKSLEKLPPETRQQALARLSQLVIQDTELDTVQVDYTGMPFTPCKFESATGAQAEAPSAKGSLLPGELASADLPISSPPVRHSKPGSSNRLYVDFNGEVVTNTAWNFSRGVDSWDCRPYDTNGDEYAFDDAEQSQIIRTWALIAEDYAPFDIDVTTEPPVTYDRYTAHAVITKTTDKNGVRLPHFGYGGIAYVGVFGNSVFHTTYSPAWVTEYSSAYAAEAASHEVGHNMGLSHDGRTSPAATYYPGHNNGLIEWNTIMGGGATPNVSQWCKGQYYNANNTEDDLAIISGKTILVGTGYRTDDHGDTRPSASALSITGATINDSGIVETTDDPDVFSFYTGAGNITINATPYIHPYEEWGNNLDILLELRDGSDTLLADSSGVAATEVKAWLTYAIPTAGTYYLWVKPTGAGDPTVSPPTGFTSYGSLGQYWLSGTVVPASGIEVVYPNGGETIYIGSSPTITWSAATSIANVKIDLYSGGAYVSTIIASTPNNGSYSGWSTSALAEGSNYQIRVSDASDAGVYDQSAAFFTLRDYDLTYPDGGEVLPLGSTISVKWSSAKALGNVDIDLYKNNVFQSTVVSNTADDGAQNWTISTALAEAGDYKLRVRNRSNGTRYDESASNFALRGILVISPRAGDSYVAGKAGMMPGDVIPITWTSSLGGNVKIDLYKGGVWNYAIVASTTNNGSYNWTIPNANVYANDYTIRVTHTTLTTLYDDSDAFTIKSLVYGNPLDSDPGWTTTGTQWAFGTPTGGGGSGVSGGGGYPDPTSGYTGSNVYGYNLSGNYDNSMSAETLTSTATINCTNYTGVELRFWRWLNVEDGSWDHAYIYASNNGSTWTKIWENSTVTDFTSSFWVPVKNEISDESDTKSTVYIRWTMGTSDTSLHFSGWNIDDIRVAGIPVTGTPVTWDTFAAYPQPGGALLKWTCASELENAGYNVYRRDAGNGKREEANGGWTKLNPTLIPGRLTYAGPTAYGWFDFGGNASCEYRVESVSLKGVTESYPEVVRPSGALLPPETGLYAMAVNLCSQYRATRAQELTVKQNQARIGGAVAQGQAARVVARSEARGEVQGIKALDPLLKGSAMPAALRAAKVRTRGQGVVWVPSASLPAGFDPQQLEVYYEGGLTTVLGGDSQGVALWAPGYEDAYTDVDAFFLVPSEVPTNVLKPNNAKGLFANNVVPQTVHTAVVEQSFHDVYYLWSSAMMPYSYPPWFSGNLLTGGTSYAFTLSTKQLSSGPGQLTVRLWSLNDGSYELGVSVNGTPVGVQGWTNGGAMLELSFAVPAGVLREGANTIELTTPDNSGWQISLLHGLILGYPQALVCEGPMSVNTDGSGSGVVEVSGLPGQKVWVVQVSAGSGVLVEYEAKGDGATYAIRWQYPLGVTARYYVVPAGMELAPLSVEDRVVSPLQERVAYLAVGKSKLGNAVQPLLDARSAEGLNALFVDQERLFDAYGNGRFGPLGILRAVRSVQPQYLLLVGRSTYDYKNYMGLQTDTGCPTVLVATKHWGQTGSDGAYGEWDGAPQVAVGRLIQDDPAGVSNAVNKILAYRGAKDSSRIGVILADVPDPSAGDFHVQADDLAAQMPDMSWTVVKQASAAASDSAAARTKFLEVVNGGAGMAAFIGHGSSTKWANGTISVGNAGEWTGLPVVLAATCNATYFLKHPEYPSATLAELLQGQSGGGMPVMIGSGTYTTSAAHVEFMKYLLKCSRKAQRWGDVLLKTRVWAEGGTSELQDVGRSEQLLGDPALPVVGADPVESSQPPPEETDAKF